MQKREKHPKTTKITKNKKNCKKISENKKTKNNEKQQKLLQQNIEILNTYNFRKTLLFVTLITATFFDVQDI